LILVTVGTHHQGFDRLVRSMDQLATQFDERVIIQRGSSSYRPRCAEHFRVTNSQEMAGLTQAARVVVGHAAAGAIILSLNYDKPLVLVPRLRKLGEVLDDHQLELAKFLDDAKMAIAVYETTGATLQEAIHLAGRQKIKRAGSGQLVKALRRQLQEWQPIEDRWVGILRG
jgi:beta-1,4-N-acetylglucosaminyltransferase